MSDRLREALRAMRDVSEEDRAPVVYLHDPETLEPFAALVTLEFLSAAESGAASTVDHSHREGGEDE